MTALVTDPKTPVFQQAATSPPEASAEQRTAKLQLSETGTLAGNVQEAYSGHRAEAIREQIRAKSPAQREEWLHDRVTRMFPDSETTGIQLENVDDPAKPLTAKYHLEAPRFAQVTGKRILFQPNAFRRGQLSPFSASDRRFPVNFPYAWSEIDEVDIGLPKGFALDNADSPGGLEFGNPGYYHLQIAVTRGDNPEIQTHREFIFGSKAMLAFQPQNYPALKRVFDAIQVRDAHTISLKEK